MKFKTPFHICGSMLLDSEYKPFAIRPKRFRLTDDRAAVQQFLQQSKAEKINLIHVEFTEALLTENNGALKDGPALELLDYFMEQCYTQGFYLAITPITEKIKIPDGRSEHAIRDDEPIFAERYFDALFRHVNRFSRRKFFEYENLVAIETILALETFTAKRLWAYLHHMGCFVQHFFLNRLLDVYFLDRGPIPPELEETLKHYTQIQPVNWFPDPEKIRINSRLAGIPASAFSAWVRDSGSSSFLPCAVADAASKSLYRDLPHGNGGAEGFITLESAGSTDFRLEFPCTVASAVFRPSMREKVPVEIQGRAVTFTLPKPRYGVVEVNYDSSVQPHFTAYVLVDPVIAAPSDALWLEPGSHESIDYTAAKTIAFKAGVHYLPDDRLRPVSNHDVYLAPGAVLKCGLTCENGENIRIYGSGIFDGTEVRRNPGENWKGRADDAFIHFFQGRQITWDGPTIFNSPFWNLVPEGTHDMSIRHHKAITWAVNSDGVQPRSCVNLLIEDCFFKCADDSIAIKTRRASGMHSRNITVRNIVTWNDAGSALEIGHTSQSDILEDVLFENIEIIRTVGGMCHIYLIDHSTVQNVRYENIYIEQNLTASPEISFTISRNFYSTDDSRGRIRQVSLKNLHVDGVFHGASLKGFDAEHRIENVTLENVYVHVGDKVYRYEDEIPYHALEFADKIRFVK